MGPNSESAKQDQRALAAGYVVHGRLSISPLLYAFVADEALAGTAFTPAAFWAAVEAGLAHFTPKNEAMLQRRADLQQQITAWRRANPALQGDAAAEEKFLRDIGYIKLEGPDFAIESQNIDAEVASIAGPQLVVPVDNERYALNAANARWGSLYDALYGTDVLTKDVSERTGAYNPKHGAKVIAYARAFLDKIAPLAQGSHADAKRYAIEGGALSVTLASGAQTELKNATGFAGYRGAAEAPEAVLLRHNGLHAEIVFDAKHPIGSTDAAGIADVVLESALTTIMDLEDSVAAVDAADKVRGYRNWLGLIAGNLTARFEKAGATKLRALNADRTYSAPNGGTTTLSGRSVMLVRNVGHHMKTDAVMFDGAEAFETVIDAFVTSAIGSRDLAADKPIRNSRTGSIYIVKPKMHGPDEVALADELFGVVEDKLGLKRHTLKMGVMDEERRTSVNLKECIRAAKSRLFFINTGFLDRTGDEIHTVMAAGPVIRKGDIRGAKWIAAYERANVDVGLACGLRGRAQIGKGMWAQPDNMAAMMSTKGAQLEAGASTAWVPSPTAATLHAMHYHNIDLAAVQQNLASRGRAPVSEMLALALLDRTAITPEAVVEEVFNNAQSILGYVVRWVDQGVGCSKVSDVFDVALMEDRATLRISAQHIANWLVHGVCIEAEVVAAFKKAAVTVDGQNGGDRLYEKMAPDFDGSIAFKAGLELALKGASQPNGYTEFILSDARRAKKKLAS